MRGHLLLLLLAFWQEDVSFLTEVVLIMAGPEAEHADAAGLEADLGELLRRYRHASLGEIQLGPLLQEIAQSATAHGVRLPASLVLTGKPRADAADRDRARPRARPVLGGRTLPDAEPDQPRPGRGRAEAALLRRLEAEGAGRTADRVVRADQRRPPGPAAAGGRARDLAARADDPRRGPPALARRHGRFGPRRDRSHGRCRERRELGRSPWSVGGRSPRCWCWTCCAAGAAPSGGGSVRASRGARARKRPCS